MITLTDLTAALDNPWAVIITAAVGGLIAGIFAEVAIWWLQLRGPDQQNDDARFRAGLRRRVGEGVRHG